MFPLIILELNLGFNYSITGKYSKIWEQATQFLKRTKLQVKNKLQGNKKDMFY